MNQILYNSSNNEKEPIQQNKNKKKNMSFFKFQFIVCTILMISTVTYYIYTLYENNKKESVSKKLLSNFNIISLYSNSNTITTKTKTITNSNESSPLIYTSEGTDFSIIGVIEIKEIQLNYPIISTYNEELLKIAPCRFFGPMPNEIGNLCIAGHNYNSYKFFSKIKNLSSGDIISIYDLSRSKNRLLCV